VSLDGFATVGVVRSSERHAVFTGSPFKSDGAGYPHAWSADVDSRLGLQLSGRLTQELSAVLQIVSEARPDGSYRPQTEWANFKLEPTPGLSFRVGRIALPAFLAGDSRKVGYAQPFVRPPGEVYSLLPVTSNDGIDVSYRVRSGPALHSFQILAGQKTERGADFKAVAKKSLGIAHVYEHGRFVFHASYHQADLTLDIAEDLFTGLRQFGPSGNALADRYDVKGKRYQVGAVGATYNTGDWFVTAEAAKVRTRSWLGDRSGWYVAGGYRFGTVTPYAILSNSRSDSATTTPGLSTAGLPEWAAAQATAMNAGLNRLLGYAPVQTTISIGARWDLARNTALKVQYDVTDMRAGSPGPLGNLQPEFSPGGKLKLLTVLVDFVF
jgi:hypothetical protein